MEFPLAAMELRRVGKRRNTYVLRALVGAAAALLIFFTWILSSSFNVGGEGIGQLGVYLAAIATGIQSISALLVGPLLASGGIAREKQDRTLGLLLMADLRGVDIILSKWFAAFLHAALLIMSTLPILAFAAFFGGVNVSEMAVQMGLMVIAAGATTAIAVLFSTVSARPFEAFFWSIAFIAGWQLAMGLADSLMGNPNLRFSFYMSAIRMWPATQSTSSFLPYLGATLALGTGAAILACRLLPRQAYDKPARTSRTPRSRRVRRASTRDPLHNLIAQSVMRHTGFMSRPLARGLCAVVLIPVSVLPCVGSLTVNALMIYGICSAISTAREQNALDELFVTPLGNERIAWGIFVSAFRRSLLFAPALYAGTWFGGGGIAGCQSVWIGMAFDSGTPVVTFVLFALCFALIVACNIALAVAAACYASINYKSVGGQTAFALVLLFATNVAASIAMGFVAVFGAVMGSESLQSLNAELLIPFFYSGAFGAVYSIVAFAVFARFRRDFARVRRGVTRLQLVVVRGGG